MALKFNCTNCNEEIIVKFLKAGETVKCRNCDSYVIIPAHAIQTEEQATIETKSDIHITEIKQNTTLNWKRFFSPNSITTAALLICLILLLNGSFIFSHYLTISENGLGIVSDMILWFAGLGLLLFRLSSYIIIVISIIGLIFSKTRVISIIVLPLFVINVLIFPVTVNIGFTIRMNAFHKLAKRSKPLIEAVKNYENKYGNPPENLEKLVPEFLERVPKTGMSAYPNYRYKTDPKVCYNNPWVITVFCPLPGINFDEFMYFPNQNYQNMTTSPFLERVDDWAYYHE